MAECSVLDLFLSLTSAGCKIRNWMFHLQVDMLQNILHERVAFPLSILPLVSTTAEAAEYNPSSRFTTAAAADGQNLALITFILRLRPLVAKAR